MTKGWSVALLFALLLLVIARYFLHIGGFWDLAMLRRIEERDPLTATLLGTISLRRLDAVTQRRIHPLLAAMVFLARGLLLVCALALSALALLLVVSAFFGGPL